MRAPWVLSEQEPERLVANMLNRQQLFLVILDMGLTEDLII